MNRYSSDVPIKRTHIHQSHTHSHTTHGGREGTIEDFMNRYSSDVPIKRTHIHHTHTHTHTHTETLRETRRVVVVLNKTLQPTKGLDLQRVKHSIKVSGSACSDKTPEKPTYRSVCVL